MGTLRRRAGLVGAAAVTAVMAGWSPAGATVDPEPQGWRAGGTWGACGSWWSETPGQVESGSVCGVDGLVTENGQATQLAEPLISVSRYVCVKRARSRTRERGPVECTSESFSGTVRRSEMTVDPLLRRASIRGSLGGCTLDVEFVGFGPARPQGSLWQSYGVAGTTPTISVGGNHTFTSQATWWGGVCGRTVVQGVSEQGDAWMFRGVEVNLSSFGGEGSGHAEH